MRSYLNRFGVTRTSLLKRSRHVIRVLVMAATLLFLIVVPRAQAATWFVADTGTDGGSCGVLSTAPCRSITQAIANAIDGDTIKVAPGRYGDLNRNGTLGEVGEENGLPACSCVLLVDKAVIVISSTGAAVTFIDARTVKVLRNVLIADDGAEFGRPGKGFTVSRTNYVPLFRANEGDGIVIAANSVMVRGNQVLFITDFDIDEAPSEGRGIHTGNQLHSVRIEGNLATDWSIGIEGGPGVTVSKNQVLYNGLGILADGGSVVGNVATNNSYGIRAYGSANVIGNATYGNRRGLGVLAPFVGVITKNNMFGNHCGLENDGVVGLAATNNYWGAPTGPWSIGGGAADEPCIASSGGTTDVTPFATKPFAVKVLKP